VICGLPPGDYNLTSGCHGDRISTNFSPLVSYTTEEAGKNAETGFMQCSPNCHYRNNWCANSKISTYIVKANFLKIVAFKGTVRNF
jgi:hypothetical protein